MLLLLCMIGLNAKAGLSMNALTSKAHKVNSANFAHRFIPMIFLSTILPMETSLASENIVRKTVSSQLKQNQIPQESPCMMLY
jgi:hypothetical protein